jgi:hypothetical protein
MCINFRFNRHIKRRDKHITQTIKTFIMYNKKPFLLTVLICAGLISAEAQWLLTGNAGTNETTNFIGTRDVRSLNIRTNNITRMIVGSSGGISITDPGASANNSAPLLLYMQKNSPGSALQIGMMSPTNGSAGIWAATRGPGYAIAGVASLTGSIGIYGSNSYGVGIQGESYNTWGVVARSTNYYGLVAIGKNYAAYFVGNVFTSGGYYAASDQKLKKDIQEIPGAMTLINQLHPKKYSYRNDGYYGMMKLPGGTQYGLVAQEVEKILPGLVNDTKYDAPMERTGAPNSESPELRKSETIQYKALNYTGLIPIMIKGMQEQEEKLQQQQEQINNQNKKIEELSTLVNQLISMRPPAPNSKPHNDKNISAAGLLHQNAPNPFHHSTVIHYYVPEKAGKALINFTDVNGILVQSFPALAKGKGQLRIEGGVLLSGSYQYSLIVDGKLIDTKN